MTLTKPPSNKNRHSPLWVLEPDGPSVLFYLLRVIKHLVRSDSSHPVIVLMKVKLTLQNIQKMIRLALGREQFAVLHHCQLCGVVGDLLVTRSRALQQSAIEIIGREVKDVDDVPDTAIVSLLVVKQGVRKMFSAGHSVQHFPSGLGWNRRFL